MHFRIPTARWNSRAHQNPKWSWGITSILEWSWGIISILDWSWGIISILEWSWGIIAILEWSWGIISIRGSVGALGPIFEGSIQGDRSGPWDPFGGRRPTKWGSGGEAPRKMGPIWVPFGGPIQGRRHGALARYHFLGTFSHGTVAHSHMALCRAHSHMAPWHILHMPKKVSTII